MPRFRNTNGMSQRSRAYDQLRQALLHRQVPEGQRLRETDWAERLDVNRAAFREACGRLCVEGLVNEGPKGGYFAAHLEPDEIQDAREIRVLLEAGAVEQICRRGLNRPRHLKPLQSACEEMEWLLSRGYAVELTESDRRFHEGLVAIAGSKRLASIYRCVAPAHLAVSLGDGQGLDAYGQKILHEHRGIIAALQKGRATEAQQLLRAHLAGRASAPDAHGIGVA